MGCKQTWLMQLLGCLRDKATCPRFSIFPLPFAEKHWNSSSSLRPRDGSHRQRTASPFPHPHPCSPWISSQDAKRLLYPQPWACHRNSESICSRLHDTLFDSCLCIPVPSSRLGFTGHFSLTIKKTDLLFIRLVTTISQLFSWSQMLVTEYW